MALYFITGNAGTGKSTVIKALQEKRYTAYDIDDEPSLHGYIDKEMNEIIDVIPENGLKGAASFARYASILKEDGLKRLSIGKPVFLGGSVTNQIQFYPMFAKIFGLIADEEILNERLKQRTNNTTGNSNDDREYLLSINKRVETNLRRAGAILIDTSQPLEIVIQQILEAIHEHPKLA